MDRRRQTYWKIQTWDAKLMTWRDVQVAYDAAEDAEAARPAGRSRLIEVTPRHRGPVPGSDRTR
jgi:hypothetical protein